MKSFLRKKSIAVTSVFFVGIGAAGISVAAMRVGEKFQNVSAPQPVAEGGTNLEITENKGVSVRCSFKAGNETDVYGTYRLDYTVTPAIFTDEIVAQLTYSDGETIPETVLAMDHLPSNLCVVVHCKDVFLKKAALRLYAKSNPTVYAVLTFDFRERLTVTLPSTITLAEGEIPHITPAVATTGGTVTVRKEIANVRYTWNAGFLTWVMNQATKFLASEMKSLERNCSVANGVLGSPTGLTDADLAAFFTNPFSANSFLTEEGYSYSYEYAFSDDDSADPWSTCQGFFSLGEAEREAFLTEFSGTAPIIDYHCTVNDVAYEKSFGLDIAAIGVSKIVITDPGFVI
jgi:hypothetical protein